jgi:hypothetical protein
MYYSLFGINLFNNPKSIDIASIDALISYASLEVTSDPNICRNYQTKMNIQLMLVLASDISPLGDRLHRHTHVSNRDPWIGSWQ